MRTVELNNPELFNLVKENNVHLIGIRKILEEGEKLEVEMDGLKKKLQKAQVKQNKVLEKLKPVAIATTSGIECGEFEYIKDVEIKEEKLVANIEDALENWKVAYKEKTSTLGKVKQAQK